MNPLVKYLPLALLSLMPAMLSGKTLQPVQDLTLDEKKIHTIPVAGNRVTTVNFPSPISALDGAMVTTDGTSPGLFQLAHQPGTSFFSVRSLARGVTTNLNVRWKNRTYVLLLKESAEPVLSAIFRPEAITKKLRPGPITPGRLVGLLDQAKAYPLLKEHQPEAVKNIEVMVYGDQPPVMDYEDYEVRLQEVYRFEVEDTLIFQIVLKNKTKGAITYRTDGFGVRVGERFYSQSVSDASGTMAPGSDSLAYFAITGTPEGGRNDLSLKNEFIILVDRTSSPEPKPTPTPKAKSKSTKKGRK